MIIIMIIYIYMMGQGYPKTYKSFEVGVLTAWGQLIRVSPIRGSLHGSAAAPRCKAALVETSTGRA